MATILDLGLLNYFVPIITFLFVWVILFALVEKAGFFGDNKNINAFFTFLTAMLFMFISPAVELIRVMTPWFVVLFIFIVLMMLLFMVVGIEASTLTEFVWGNSALLWILFIVGLGIFGYALSTMYGEQIQDVYAGDSDEGGIGLAGDIFKVIFHPKLLGVMLILVIASQAIRLLSSVPS